MRFHFNGNKARILKLKIASIIVIFKKQLTMSLTIIYMKDKITFFIRKYTQELHVKCKSALKEII